MRQPHPSALITGASTGIGRATALLLDRHGLTLSPHKLQSAQRHN